MDVRLGATVFGSGGKRIGEVEGLIVDAGTKRATALLVGGGLLDRNDHMVAVSAIQSASADGIRLEDTRAWTAANAPELESEEVALPQRVAPDTTFIPAAGVGGPVYADEPALPGAYPDDSSFFELAPLDPPPVEIKSNLEENEVRLTKSTEAVSRDGHKVGDVVAFVLGDMGLVDQITVAEGFIRKEQTTFALADLGEFGTNKVHLRLSKDEVERR